MIVNVHQRHVGADADRVGELLETWGSPGDRLWRTELAEPTAFDRGLAVGSSGGHGPVRYRVVEHVPGRSVRAKFEPGIGLRGHHGFEVVPKGDGECILRHEAVATAHGSARLTWPLLIRPIHDAVVEDVFDHVERTLTGTTQRPQPTGRLTAFAARRVLARWVEECTGRPDRFRPRRWRGSTPATAGRRLSCPATRTARRHGPGSCSGARAGPSASCCALATSPSSRSD